MASKFEPMKHNIVAAKTNHIRPSMDEGWKLVSPEIDGSQENKLFKAKVAKDHASKDARRASKIS
jgi:hypothetical protein